MNNCSVNIEKAKIRYKSIIGDKEINKSVKIKDIRISVETAKIEPQTLFFAAKKCFITSSNLALTADKIRIITDKIVIKPVVFQF